MINEPTGETFCVGIVSAPVGCQALFGISVAPLRGKVVDLEQAWPAARALRHNLLGMSGSEEMLDLVEDTLLTGLDADGASVDRCEAAVKALEADPVRSIQELAGELGVSHGHLDREFIATVGSSPRALSRILRLRALLADIDIYRPISWTRCAMQWGWFDQSHFIRDFKRHTGVTPSAYVAAQRGAFTPDQATPGFVPER